jgi:hypothetical protein
VLSLGAQSVVGSEERWIRLNRGIFWNTIFYFPTPLVPHELSMIEVFVFGRGAPAPQAPDGKQLLVQAVLYDLRDTAAFTINQVHDAPLQPV